MIGWLGDVVAFIARPSYADMALPEPHQALYVDPGPASVFDPTPDPSLGIVSVGNANMEVLRAGARMGLRIELDRVGEVGLIDWAEFEFLYWLACGLGVGDTEWQGMPAAAGSFSQPGDPANTWAPQTDPGGAFADSTPPVTNTWSRSRG